MASAADCADRGERPTADQGKDRGVMGDRGKTEDKGKATDDGGVTEG